MIIFFINVNKKQNFVLLTNLRGSKVNIGHEIIIPELEDASLFGFKENHYCAILIGDTRKAQHYIPLSYYLLQIFLKTGFVLKEEIIKAQHNCVYSKKWV